MATSKKTASKKTEAKKPETVSGEKTEAKKPETVSGEKAEAKKPETVSGKIKVVLKGNHPIINPDSGELLYHNRPYELKPTSWVKSQIEAKILKESK